MKRERNLSKQGSEGGGRVEDEGQGQVAEVVYA